MNQQGAVDLDLIQKSMEPESWDLLQRNKGKVRGFVPEYDFTKRKMRLVHHSEAPLAGAGPEKQWNPKVFRETPISKALFDDLPPIVRRTARQRYDELVKRLLGEMRQVKAVLGKTEMPASIRKQVEHVAWVKGDPTLVSRIENAEPEAVEIYAGFLMEDAANKQKAKDRKKSALDWGGHYNA